MSDGGRETLVFVPGRLCTGALFQPQIAALGAYVACVVADHTRHETAEAAATAILSEVPDRFSLAGLSLGGFIALEMVRQAPERVTRLALLDTSARAERADRADRMADRAADLDLAAREGIAGLQAQYRPLLVHPERQGDPELMATIDAMAKETGVNVFCRQQRCVMTRREQRPFLSAIGCPTLVLVGDSDALTPPKLAEEMAAAIPGARLEVIANCGHLSTLERPEEVTKALKRWLGVGE